MVNAFVPIAAAGAMLVVAGTARTLLRVVAASVLVVCLIAQGILAVFVLNSYEILPYLAGSEDASAYLSRARPFMRAGRVRPRSCPTRSRDRSPARWCSV